MMTMSHTASDTVLLHHFLLAVSDGTYSFNHLPQKCSTFSWLYRNCFSVVWVVLVANFSGEYGLAPAWRKWFGAIGSGSSGSTLRWVKGREFHSAVTSVATVASTGLVTNRFFRTTRMACLHDFTSLAHIPPKCDPWGGINAILSDDSLTALLVLFLFS